MTKTYMLKPAEIKRNCYVLDATDQILGRIAAKAATLLRGKHKVTYTPHVDGGDTVIIINAEKIRVTGKKLLNKEYQRYTGFPGGQRIVTLENMLAKKPTEVLKLAVGRMIPKGAQGAEIKKRLKIYAGDKHPHQAQKPVSISL